MEEGISIIVPIYNTNLDYLKECVESILNQNYTDMEIILINDGSTNLKIKDVLEEHKNKDSRVRVINKENSGVSATRNIGIKEATKKWIMFVDADDYLVPDACSSLLYECSDDTDIIISKNYVIHSNKKIIEVSNKCSGNLILTTENEKRDLINSIFRDGDTMFHFVDTPWAKLYRKEFIINNNIEFKEDIKMAEDGLFNFQAFMDAKKIKYIHKATYYYRKNDESVCHKCNYFIIDNYKKVFDYYQNQFKKMNKDFASDYNYFIYRQVRNIIERYFFNRNNKKSKKELKNEMHEFLNYPDCKYAIDCLKISDMDKKNKILFAGIKTKNYYIINFLFRLKERIKK